MTSVILNPVNPSLYHHSNISRIVIKINRFNFNYGTI